VEASNRVVSVQCAYACVCGKESKDMRKLMAAVLCVPLMAAVPSVAQYNGQQDRQYNRGEQQYHRGDHQRFYNGAYEGGRGGDYYGHDRDQHYQEYDRRYHEGGIGPGKGALIGGAGGAALGALFTGSAKGAIIGGAAGAGIGAILGEHAQDNRERRY